MGRRSTSGGDTLQRAFKRSPRRSPVNGSTVIRVLVASPDARFLKLAGFLLPRTGLLIRLTQQLRGAERLAHSHSADVVVVDKSHLDAHRLAQRLGEARPTFGVVFIGELNARGSDDRIVGKWALQELGDAILEAHGRSSAPWPSEIASGHEAGVQR